MLIDRVINILHNSRHGEILNTIGFYLLYPIVLRTLLLTFHNMAHRLLRFCVWLI